MASRSYHFAHRSLPGEFFNDPDAFMGRLRGDEGPAVIESLWRNDEDEGGESPALVVHDTPDAGSVAVVQMPVPEAAGEAHFVALILRDGNTGTHRWARCFTLERAIDLLEGNEMTMLCEWDAGGRHINHGEGPEPGQEPFLKAAFKTLIAEAQNS